MPSSANDGGAAILITLVAYKLVLLAIGLWAHRRNRDSSDYFLGGRSLGPFVAAISASASSSSAWTMLGVSGFAYAKGLSALWLFPSCVGGFALNWYVLAPRLRRMSHANHSLTVTEFLAGPREAPLHRPIKIFASLIILFSLLVYVTSQFQGAGKTFAETFGMDRNASILLGSTIVVAYTLLGGFWAVSLTDTLQGMVMAITATLLPIAALARVGLSGLSEAITETSATVPGYSSVTGDFAGTAAVGLVLGFLGIGLGYPGQPHVVNRFMALRDDDSVATGRRVAMGWAIVVYAGMILLGLCGRALQSLVLQDGETIMIAAANELFTPVLAGVMIAAVLSAIMSTADSQLLVASSSVSHDLGAAGKSQKSVLWRSRLVVLTLSAAAVVAAISGSQEIFSPVLFAWTAMGAAFGPLLVLTVSRGPVPPLATLCSMATGFSVAVGTHFLGLGAEDKWLSQVVPFVLASVVAIALSNQRTAETR